MASMGAEGEVSVPIVTIYQRAYPGVLPITIH
jgi:hypothetical protein